MSKRQLCHEARRIGVAPNDVEQFLDDEISKEQFIELVVGKMPDPRNDLRAMSKKELRLEAEKLGVSAADIERFRFDEIGTSQFIELVVDRIEVRHKKKNSRRLQRKRKHPCCAAGHLSSLDAAVGVQRKPNAPAEPESKPKAPSAGSKPKAPTVTQRGGDPDDEVPPPPPAPVPRFGSRRDVHDLPRSGRHVAGRSRL